MFITIVSEGFNHNDIMTDRCYFAGREAGQKKKPIKTLLGKI